MKTLSLVVLFTVLLSGCLPVGDHQGSVAQPGRPGGDSTPILGETDPTPEMPMKFRPDRIAIDRKVVQNGMKLYSLKGSENAVIDSQLVTAVEVSSVQDGGSVEISGRYLASRPVNSDGSFDMVLAVAADREVVLVASNDELDFSTPITLPKQNVYRLPGDANGDGCVDYADFDVWRDNFNRNVETYTDGDFNGDGRVAIGDYTTWANSFGQCVGE